MRRRYIIPFLTCLSALIVSEYFLLAEVYRLRRIPVIIVCAVALAGSILTFWYYYRKFRKSVVESAQA